MKPVSEMTFSECLKEKTRSFLYREELNQRMQEIALNEDKSESEVKNG